MSRWLVSVVFCFVFLVCFRARYTVGYAVWRLGTEEPRLLGHGTRSNQERYAAALATGNCPLASEDHTKVQKKLVSMRSYHEELSLRTRHGIRGLSAQS